MDRERRRASRLELYRAWDEHEEAGFVAQTIRGLRGEGCACGDVAVFYRTNAQSRVLEDALRRAGIPYVIVGGVRFYERREIKDVLAYLRLVSIRPTTWRSAARSDAPARGIGGHDARRAWTRSARGRRGRCWRWPPSRRPTSAARRARTLQEFAALDRAPGRAATRPGAAGVHRSRARASGYREALQARSAPPEAEARLENLEELVAAAEDYHARRRRADARRLPGRRRPR